jgi:hypothetical protein
MLAKHSADLASFHSSLQYEGHPWLWHHLLYGLTTLGLPAVSMQLLHGVIACATAGLVVFASPFAKWQRWMLVLGYFFFFEYAVISRNYGIGALLMVLATMLLCRERVRWVLLGIVLGLLANTNLFATIVAVAWTAAMWMRCGLQREQRGWWACGVATLVALAGVAMAVVQMWPPRDGVYAGPWVTSVDVVRGGMALAAVYRSHLPLPPLSESFWNNNLLDVVPIAQPVLGLLLLMAISWRLRPSVLALLMWALPTAGMLLFFYSKFPGTSRHHGQLFVCTVCALWAARRWQAGGSGDSRQAVAPLRREGLLGVIAVAQLLGGVWAAVVMMRVPFTTSGEVARYIKQQFPDDIAVAGDIDFAFSSVAGALGRPVYYLSGNTNPHFIVWNDRRRRLNTPAVLTERLNALAARNRGELIVVLNHTIDPAPSQLREVARFERSIVEDERFVVYRWTEERR